MSEENKAVARRLIEESGNNKNLDVIPELVTPGYVCHQAGGEDTRGHEGLRQLVTMFFTAFPDVHITIEDQIADGDKVVTRWTARGTHQGNLQGIAPTGKQITVSGISIDRFEAGKIAEEWELFDRMGMMQQLGVIPSLQRG